MLSAPIPARLAPTAAADPAPRWGPVLALAGLHAAVTLAWVVYNLYLVELLVRAGFDAYLASVLITVEGVLGAVIEPLTGALSDRVRRTLFRRFFLVLGGVLLAALLFVALPLAARGARPGPASLVPALLIGWACAMAVFRAPALALLGRYARPGALPLAASVLTSAGALVSAAAPSVRGRLLALGALPTFAAASLALLVGALVLRALDRRSPVADAPVDEPGPLDRRDARAAWLLFAVGTTAALGFRFLLDGLPRAGASPGATAPAILTAFFLGAAVAGIPLGRLALDRGGRAVTAAGLGTLAVGAAAALLLGGGTPVLIWAAVLGAALAALQNGLFAFSLSAVRLRSGLGMGLLLGGGGAALGLFNALVAVRRPVPGSSLLAAAALYALTLVLLLGTRQSGPRGA